MGKVIALAFLAISAFGQYFPPVLTNIPVPVPGISSGAGFVDTHAALAFSSAVSSEASVYVRSDGVCQMWYTDYTGGLLGYREAVDADCAAYGSATPVGSSITAYPDVEVIQGLGFGPYILLVEGTNNLYMFASATGLPGSFVIQNSGNPVLHHDTGLTISNSTLQAVGSTFYLMVEENGGPNGPSIYYSTAPVSTSPNFDTNAVVLFAATGSASTNLASGNPTLKYVADRDAFIVIYGDISATNWKLRARTALRSATLTSASNWTLSPNFLFANSSGSGLGITDPYLTVASQSGYTGKQFNIILPYEVDQGKIYQAYSSATLDQLYDAILGNPAPLGDVSTLGGVYSPQVYAGFSQSPKKNCPYAICTNRVASFLGTLSTNSQAWRGLIGLNANTDAVDYVSIDASNIGSLFGNGTNPGRINIDPGLRFQTTDGSVGWTLFQTDTSLFGMLSTGAGGYMHTWDIATGFHAWGATGGTRPVAAADIYGQIRTESTAPTIASNACGSATQGVLSGASDVDGLLTVGTAAVTTCTVTLSRTYPNAFRGCVLTPANTTAAAQGTTLAYVSAISTSNWTVTGSALASAAYYYHCE